MTIILNFIGILGIFIQNFRPIEKPIKVFIVDFVFIIEASNNFIDMPETVSRF